MSDASRSVRDPDSSEQARSSNDKVHPSEFLEFITVANPASHRLQPLRVQVQANQDLDKHASENQIHITRSNDDLFFGLSRAIPGLRRLSVEARAATKAEHAMTFLRGCRLYPKAMMWSVLLSMTIVMEGYDKTLINSFYAFPVFRRSYGTPINPSASRSELDYQISPAWQSGLTNAALVGEIFGLMFNGFLTDRWGYHKTMVLTLVWMSLFVFLAFFAVNIRMLLAAQILCGLPWGVFQVRGAHCLDLFRANSFYSDTIDNIRCGSHAGRSQGVSNKQCQSVLAHWSNTWRFGHSRSCAQHFRMVLSNSIWPSVSVARILVSRGFTH